MKYSLSTLSCFSRKIYQTLKCKGATQKSSKADKDAFSLNHIVQYNINS